MLAFDLVPATADQPLALVAPLAAARLPVPVVTLARPPVRHPPVLAVPGVVPLALDAAGDVLVLLDLLTLVPLPVVLVGPAAPAAPAAPSATCALTALTTLSVLFAPTTLPALSPQATLPGPSALGAPLLGPRLLGARPLVVPALPALPAVPVLPLARPELPARLPVLDLLGPAPLSLAPALPGLLEPGPLVPVLLERALPASVPLVLAPVFPPADVALLVAPGHLLLAVFGRALLPASGPPGALGGLLLVQARLRVALPGVLVDARALATSALPTALCLLSAASPVSVVLAHGYHGGRIETSRPSGDPERRCPPVGNGSGRKNGRNCSPP